jgi:hypothetical protein
MQMIYYRKTHADREKMYRNLEEHAKTIGFTTNNTKMRVMIH